MVTTCLANIVEELPIILLYGFGQLGYVID